jgi:phospholipid/cholesterol/gamma-HCH transport system substrate-binding protein
MRVTGVSDESLLRSAETLANTLADPELIADLKSTLNNAVDLTNEATELSRELTQLANTAQAEVRPLSDSVQRATNDAAEAAQAIQLTATDVQRLIRANELNLATTLENINRGSERLTIVVDTLASEFADDTRLVDDLRTLSSNAAAAAINIRQASLDVQQLTSSLNQRENVLLIQQTLESARDVFQGAQKVLSDVDEVTGDPAVRNNLRDLINGLSNLVSSAEMLEQQAQLATALAPLNDLTAPINVAVPSQAPTLSSDYRRFQQQLEGLATVSDPTEDDTP